MNYHTNHLDSYSLRKDFPILRKRVNGRPLVWLDNSATTQKPRAVIDSLDTYYSETNSNVHRGAHTLARQATDAYEDARKKVQMFIGASSPEEIIFVRGATEAINLVSQTYGNANIKEDDEILLTMMEHHSNIVPWQKLRQSNGAIIKPIPINDHGEVILEEYEKLFTPRTKMVAITHVSNVLGTVNPVRTMIEIAHKHGAIVLVDGAQSVPHLGVNVNQIDADFYVFSGHKIYGPTGIGVLYGKRILLEAMPPWQRGGGMIKDVSFDKTTYNGLPNKFEAGTGNIADAVALGTAIDYIQNIGIDRIEEHERTLTKYAMHALSEIPGIRLIGTSPSKTSVIAFVIDGISSDSVARYLNGEGIAVRSGHHCAQPALRRFGLDSAVRASLGMYNTKEEIDCLVNAVRKISRS
uniref:cysteine desulfurase n=1 Tax=Vallitalea okinawensis TaxID=2078660 RepID=UPI001FA924D2|nr:cysteine desulfurase [Vallitalea okinawensis]